MDDNASDPNVMIREMARALVSLNAKFEALEKRISTLEGARPVPAPNSAGTAGPLSEAALCGAQGEQSADLAVGRQAPNTGSAAEARQQPPIFDNDDDIVRPKPPERQSSVISRMISEFFISGNPLNKIGALTLLISAGLFFKAAVDNEWIGPAGRVTLAIIGGLALLGFGEYSQKRRWANIASGFVGAGAGIIYIALYNGQHRYEIVPPGAAFFLDLLLTAVILAQAMRYNSQVVSVMGLLGGFVTPILASTGSKDFAGLSCYLLLLNTAVFAIAYHKRWNTLKWLAFTFTEIYLIVWAAEVAGHPMARLHHYSLSLSWLVPFLALFFLYFSALSTFRNLLRQEPFSGAEIYLTVANGLVNFSILYLVLHNDHRPYLGLAALAVAAVYFCVCGKLLNFAAADRRTYDTLLSVGAWFLFAAVPMIVSKHYITIAWSLEAAAIAWYSTNERCSILFRHVLAILALVAVRLVFWDHLLSMPHYTDNSVYYLLGDPASQTGAVVALSFYFILRLTRQNSAWVRVAPGFWIAGVGLLLAVAFHESFSAVGIGCHDLLPSHVIDFVSFALWAALSSVILAIAVNVLEYERTVYKALAGVLTVFLVLPVFCFWELSEYAYYNSMHNHGTIAIAEHSGSLLLLLVIFVASFVVFPPKKSSPPTAEAEESRKQFGSKLLLGSLILMLFVIRRELHSLIFLPPLADAILPMNRESAYQMSLSCAYALVSFVLYLVGVNKEERSLIRIAYALFAVTGFKVYLYDLGSVAQIYRALSLLVFGMVLLISEFLKQRIIQTKKGKMESEA